MGTKHFVPQWFSFSFLDQILEETDRKLVGIKNVSANESFFVGHFPDHPVMPGVLIFESLAQAAGILVRKIAGETTKTPKVVSSEKMRFRRPVVPGDQLILEVELIEWNGQTGKVKGIAKVNDEIAAIGDLTIALENA